MPFEKAWKSLFNEGRTLSRLGTLATGQGEGKLRIQTNSKIKLATLVKGDPKAHFSIATTLRCREGCNFIP